MTDDWFLAKVTDYNSMTFEAKLSTLEHASCAQYLIFYLRKVVVLLISLLAARYVYWKHFWWALRGVFKGVGCVPREPKCITPIPRPIDPDPAWCIDFFAGSRSFWAICRLSPVPALIMPMRNPSPLLLFVVVFCCCCCCCRPRPENTASPLHLVRVVSALELWHFIALTFCLARYNWSVRAVGWLVGRSVGIGLKSLSISSWGPK